MNERDRAVIMLDTLHETYPDSRHYLNFSNPLELMVATILSAQTHDTRVNALTPSLFAKYKTAEDYGGADLNELTEMVNGVTYFSNKAKYIKNACQILAVDHYGEVPKTKKELVALPGIGNKSANAILINAFDVVEGITVDTHVIRLSNRWGFTKTKNPDKIEKDLMNVVPHKYWNIITSLMKDHGRAICGRNPKCDECVISEWCPKVGV